MRPNDTIWDIVIGPGPHPVRDTRASPACFKVRSIGQFEFLFLEPRKDLEMLGLEKRNHKYGDGSAKGHWVEEEVHCFVLAGSWN